MTTFELLERQFWNAVEDIGKGDESSIRSLNDEELAAFAEGCARVLVLGLEQLQGTDQDENRLKSADAGRWHDQLRAAVGEQLRRRHPGQRCCSGRKLNEWLEKIRDWRVKLVDEADESAFEGTYKGRRDFALGREMEQWARRGDRSEKTYEQEIVEAEKWRLIRRELDALQVYRIHLLNDRGWTEKRWKRLTTLQAEKQAAITTNAQPTTNTL
jgi:hypothetical protein